MRRPSTIVHAVEEGRRIFDNILKSIAYLLSCNVGEILCLFVATLLNWAEPLLPIHLLFVNLVAFDMHHGHRRDVEHYAQALETFDRQLPDVLALLGKDDLLLISADHGCDPTFRGTDHTREYVPLLAYGRWMNKVIDLGTRATFADVAATVADYFGAPERFDATTFLDQIMEGKT